MPKQRKKLFFISVQPKGGKAEHVWQRRSGKNSAESLALAMAGPGGVVLRCEKRTRWGKYPIPAPV
jgi:hypothetical protein